MHCIALGGKVGHQVVKKWEQAEVVVLQEVAVLVGKVVLAVVVYLMTVLLAVRQQQHLLHHRWEVQVRSELRVGTHRCSFGKVGGAQRVEA